MTFRTGDNVTGKDGSPMGSYKSMIALAMSSGISVPFADRWISMLSLSGFLNALS